MPDPQVLHDDYGDAITVEADGIAIRDGRLLPSALLVTFWDSPFHEASEAYTRMRLSGERLAAFTEAIDRHAAHLAVLASGSDDE